MIPARIPAARLLAVVVCVATLPAAVAAPAEPIGAGIADRFGGSIGRYLNPYLSEAPRMERLSAGVFAFSQGVDRSLVIDAGDGLVVIDPFNAGHAAALQRAADEALKGQVASTAVSTAICSHHHLDHVQGADVLKPARVIAHHFRGARPGATGRCRTGASTTASSSTCGPGWANCWPGTAGP